MVNEITSNIVNQLGGGSGVDTNNLVNQLVELERAPQEQRLDRQEERLESEISGLGLLRQSVDEFQGAVEALANPDTFNAKSASISDTSLMAVNALEPDAVPGNYRVKIERVAQSQSLSSGTYESLDTAVGTGSLTLRFGDWDGTATFGLDSEAQGATIEIDQSNNSLSGLRDAINEADIGVQASIVGQDGAYQLLITGPTGATKELEITAAEGGEPGLASFNYNEAEQNLTQQQAGQDAIIRVNGLQVTRSNNTIDDVIDGVEFDIFNSSATEEISININEDRSMSEQAIRDFVEAYNTFYKDVQFLTDNESGEEGQGSLRNDSLADGLLRTLRSTLGSGVPGIESGFSALATIGIRTRQDGTLQIVEDGSSTDFQAAMNNHFEAVKDLFVPDTRSSSSRIDVIDFNGRSQPGNYEVVITQEATKGLYEGAATTGFPLNTTGKDYSFTVKVDGRESAQITLPDGNEYANGDELAAELQSLINSDSNLREGFAEVAVTFDANTNQLTFESDRYGASSKVEFTSVGADMADLGISQGSGTAGQNVAGTIDGREAFGFGNILRPALGDPAEGLAMEVLSGATPATIGFSRGIGSTLMGQLDSYLRSSGSISQRESTLKDDLGDVADDREALDRRIDSFRAIQEAKFRSMEQIVRSLNSTGDFLEGINDRLPFTARND